MQRSSIKKWRSNAYEVFFSRVFWGEDERKYRMLCEIILDFLLSPTYRLSKPVTGIHVHWNYDTYSVCPRCKATMEREYQAFCDRCGQRLDWSKYENVDVVYTGWSGPDSNGERLTKS